MRLQSSFSNAIDPNNLTNPKISRRSEKDHKKQHSIMTKNLFKVSFLFLIFATLLVEAANQGTRGGNHRGGGNTTPNGNASPNGSNGNTSGNRAGTTSGGSAAVTNSGTNGANGTPPNLNGSGQPCYTAGCNIPGFGQPGFFQGSAPASTPSGFVNKDDYGTWGTSPGQAPPGLIEPSKCIPFSSPLVQTYINNPAHTTYMNYDPRCDTNNCPSGCCRYNPFVMRCDYDNLFAQQPVSFF